MEVLRLDHYKIKPIPEIGMFRVQCVDPIINNIDGYFLRTLLFDDNHSGNGFHIEYEKENSPSLTIGVLHLPNGIKVSDGDIVTINRQGTLRVVLHKHSNANTLLVTERCDNLCVFCSQPPKEAHDNWLYKDAVSAIADFRSDEVVGISGGEPLLDRGSFLRLLASLDNIGNQTPLHILTNGRAFSDNEFCEQVKMATCLRNVTFGIPVYSYKSTVHDDLVGATGAWRETMAGLLNASSCGLNIELRIIPMLANLEDVSGLITLLARTVPSIEQFSIMNLEPHGYARKNWDSLYVSPDRYQRKLNEWCKLSTILNIPLRLFNYPLCQTPQGIRRFTTKSISDWKNIFLEECGDCTQKDDCCGVFTSANLKFQPSVKPFI